MPRLPDYTDIKLKTPVPSQDRPHYSAAGFTFIPNWKTNPLIGVGKEIESVAADQYDKYQRVEEAKTAADLSVQIDKLYMQQSLNPDYKNAANQFREQGRALVEQAASRVPSGLFGMSGRNELFAARAGAAIESHALSLDKHAVTMWHNDVVEQGTQTLNDLAEQSAMPGLSDEAKTQKLSHAMGVIDSWVQTGIRTPIQGQVLKRQYIQNYGTLYGKNLSPEQQLELSNKILPPPLPVPPPGSPAANLGRPISADRKRGFFYDTETDQYFDKGGQPMPPPPPIAAPAHAAAVRTNNPGAQWPSSLAMEYGAVGYENLKDGNKIAVFPTPVHGAASNMALLDKSYVGLTIAQAERKWSGGHRAGLPGYSPNTVITKEMTQDPDFMISFMKATANAEAPSGATVMSNQEWKQAFDLYQVGPGR